MIAARTGVEVALTGDEEVLGRELARLGGASAGLRVVHAPDTIEMREHSVRDVRNRRQSSIYVGMELIKRGEADAFVSAGNTGAVLMLALVVLGRMRGVERPALGALLPARERPTLMLDAGANAEARVSHLVQFAQLGTAYMRGGRGVAEPSVGLLNLGEESTKGSPLTIEAHAALSAARGVRFIGNVEGGDVLAGVVDVIVTDGFHGQRGAEAARGGGVGDAERGPRSRAQLPDRQRGGTAAPWSSQRCPAAAGTTVAPAELLCWASTASSWSATAAATQRPWPTRSARRPGAVESGMMDALRTAVPDSQEASSEGAASR